MKSLDESTIIKLRKRMLRKAEISKHPDPEGIASTYVVRLLEGYHQRATIDQAYVDICRLISGRKGQPGYDAKKRLNMLALTDEQNGWADRQPSIPTLTDDQRIDLNKALNLIDCKRTQDIFLKFIQGWTQGEIAESYKLTESRVNQIILRELASIRAILER